MTDQELRKQRLDVLLRQVEVIDLIAQMRNAELAYLTLVRRWGRSIESADTYTFGHSERVASYAALVSATLGLNETQRTTVRVGAYLHDLGKVRVPLEILSKPGALTTEEFAIIKRHPEWGVELIRGMMFPWDIVPIILSHHEKLDGSGYPSGLRGSAVPYLPQIIGIVDVYDALTTTRSYRPLWSHDDAIAEIRRVRHWWKADIFDAFARSIDRAAAALAQHSDPDEHSIVPEKDIVSNDT